MQREENKGNKRNQSEELKDRLSFYNLASFFPTEGAEGNCQRFIAKGVSEMRSHFILTGDCFICQSKQEVGIEQQQCHEDYIPFLQVHTQCLKLYFISLFSWM